MHDTGLRATAVVSWAGGCPRGLGIRQFMRLRAVPAGDIITFRLADPPPPVLVRVRCNRR